MKAIQCPICYEDSYDSVYTRCGHSYCRQCLIKWTKDGHKTCPTCRRYINIPKLDPEISTPSLDRYVAIHFLLGLHWLNPYGIRLSYYLGCHGFGYIGLYYIFYTIYPMLNKFDLFSYSFSILITCSITIQFLWSVGIYYTLDWTLITFSIGFIMQMLWHQFIGPVHTTPFQNFNLSKSHSRIDRNRYYI